jgi:hypothetical protein
LVHLADDVLAGGTRPHFHPAYYLVAASPLSNCWVHPGIGFQTDQLDFVVAVQIVESGVV